MLSLVMVAAHLNQECGHGKLSPAPTSVSTVWYSAGSSSNIDVLSASTRLAKAGETHAKSIQLWVQRLGAVAATGKISGPWLDSGTWEHNILSTTTVRLARPFLNALRALEESHRHALAAALDVPPAQAIQPFTTLRNSDAYAARVRMLLGIATHKIWRLGYWPTSVAFHDGSMHMNYVKLAVRKVPPPLDMAREYAHHSGPTLPTEVAPMSETLPEAGLHILRRVYVTIGRHEWIRALTAKHRLYGSTLPAVLSSPVPGPEITSWEELRPKTKERQEEVGNSKIVTVGAGTRLTRAHPDDPRWFYLPK
ncbi:hypothetical protein OC834_007600, partial [Tilletia horrida]